ncbi:MAG: AAA family ATPase [Planctomycetes bacterium]|nr:AAA family ATPase [Planctomycetota bacterium]
MSVIAIVGLAGAGKSELAAHFVSDGYGLIHFGDATLEEMGRRGLAVNEANERAVREELRRVHGMAAYAIINLPRIERSMAAGPVACDGLYSWEEYLSLREKFGGAFILLAIYASPATRYARLARRAVRGLTPEQAQSRDRAEIEKLNKGGPIAYADYTIVNEGTLEDLRREYEWFRAWDAERRGKSG